MDLKVKSPEILDSGMGENQIIFDNIHITISLADWETYLNYCVLFWETRLGQVWWYISPELLDSAMRDNQT